LSGVGLSVGQPWLLWALLVCPLLLLATWRSRLEATRRQRIGATVARVVTAALVVLAVADARVRWPTQKLAVALVLDRSASVSPREAAAVAAATPRRRIERDDVRWLDVEAEHPSAVTDLAAAIDTAVGVLPTERVRRVVLATDGRETRGDAVGAADRARRSGARVFVLPQGDRPPVDLVAVRGLEVPRLVRAGREVSVGVRLYASAGCAVRLHVLRDGERVASRDVDAPAGPSQHDVPVELPDEGVHEVTVTLTAAGDRVAENNTWRTLVRVVTPPKVLLVHELIGRSPALAAVYREAHLHVDEVSVEGVPSTTEGLDRYQYVVLDEVVMTTLTEPQQRAIRQWVEERGGGLLTTTGQHGVGREPELLREIEPIQPPRAVPEPRPIELILIIDRSGSMMGPNIVNARSAGIAAVRALRPDSRVGVVAFSGEADLVVAPVPMERAAEVTGAIAGIRASGGTNLAAALNAATNIVTDDDRYLHHVILMSDGESTPGPAIAAANALRYTGATITAITLGPRVNLMREISRIGRGRYHVTSSSTSLPTLFVREAQFRSPPPAREAAFRPLVVGRMGFMDGVDPASDPPVLGFTVSQPRPGSLTLLQGPDAAPLLSHWFVGMGQVASLTTATSSRWADAWRTGAGFRRLFGQMAWEMLRAQGDDNLELHVEAVAGRADVRRVSVVAPSTALEPAPIVTLSRGRREGVRLAVHPTSPGVWSANVALGEGFVVDARLPASREPTVAGGAELPYRSELRAFGADEAALAAIARAGGGRVLRRLDEALDDVRAERVMREARLPLLAGALLAYLLGVLALRMPRGRAAPRPAGKPAEAVNDGPAEP
jgi:Ca-activated chloride channel family protein